MKQGFTLIELMVVIAIIGILAASLLPNIGTLMDRAQAAKILSEYQTLSTAAIAHKTDTAYWPKYANTDGAVWQLLDNRRALSSWNGPYIRRPALRGDGRVKNQFDGRMMLYDVDNGYGDDWWCWQAPCSELGVVDEGTPELVERSVEISLDGRDEGDGNGNGKVKRFWGSWTWIVFESGAVWDGW